MRQLPARAKLLETDRRFSKLTLQQSFVDGFIDLGLPAGNNLVILNQATVEWLDAGKQINSDFNLVVSFASSDSIVQNLQYESAGESNVIARVRFGAQSVYSTGGTYALDTLQTASSQYLDTSPVAGSGITVNAWSDNMYLTAELAINVIYSVYSVSDVEYLRARARCQR